MRLWHEGVLVMSDFGRTFFSQHDCNHVESVRTIFYLMGGQKIPGRTSHPCLFGPSDGRFGRAEIFACPGFDLNKDQCAVAIDHDQIDFTCLAEKISREGFEALAFEESLGVFLAPAAQPRFVGQQSAFAQKRKNRKS